MTEAMPFLQKYDISFLRPPTIDGGGLPTKQNRLRQADEIGLYNRKKVGFPSVSVHRDIF